MNCERGVFHFTFLTRGEWKLLKETFRWKYFLWNASLKVFKMSQMKRSLSQLVKEGRKYHKEPLSTGLAIEFITSPEAATYHLFREKTDKAHRFLLTTASDKAELLKKDPRLKGYKHLGLVANEEQFTELYPAAERAPRKPMSAETKQKIAATKAKKGFVKKEQEVGVTIHGKITDETMDELVESISRDLAAKYGKVTGKTQDWFMAELVLAVIADIVIETNTHAGLLRSKAFEAKTLPDIKRHVDELNSIGGNFKIIQTAGNIARVIDGDTFFTRNLKYRMRDIPVDAYIEDVEEGVTMMLHVPRARLLAARSKRNTDRRQARKHKREAARERYAEKKKESSSESESEEEE